MRMDPRSCYGYKRQWRVVWYYSIAITVTGICQSSDALRQPLFQGPYEAARTDFQDHVASILADCRSDLRERIRSIEEEVKQAAVDTSFREELTDRNAEKEPTRDKSQDPPQTIYADEPATVSSSATESANAVDDSVLMEGRKQMSSGFENVSSLMTVGTIPAKDHHESIDVDPILGIDRIENDSFVPLHELQEKGDYNGFGFGHRIGGNVIHHIERNGGGKEVESMQPNDIEGSTTVRLEENAPAEASGIPETGSLLPSVVHPPDDFDDNEESLSFDVSGARVQVAGVLIQVKSETGGKYSASSSHNEFKDVTLTYDEEPVPFEIEIKTTENGERFHDIGQHLPFIPGQSSTETNKASVEEKDQVGQALFSNPVTSHHEPASSSNLSIIGTVAPVPFQNDYGAVPTKLADEDFHDAHEHLPPSHMRDSPAETADIVFSGQPMVDSSFLSNTNDENLHNVPETISPHGFTLESVPEVNIEAFIMPQTDAEEQQFHDTSGSLTPASGMAAAAKTRSASPSSEAGPTTDEEYYDAQESFSSPNLSNTQAGDFTTDTFAITNTETNEEELFHDAFESITPLYEGFAPYLLRLPTAFSFDDAPEVNSDGQHQFDRSQESVVSPVDEATFNIGVSVLPDAEAKFLRESPNSEPDTYEPVSVEHSHYAHETESSPAKLYDARGEVGRKAEESLSAMGARIKKGHDDTNLQSRSFAMETEQFYDARESFLFQHATVDMTQTNISASNEIEPVAPFVSERTRWDELPSSDMGSTTAAPALQSSNRQARHNPDSRVPVAAKPTFSHFDALDPAEGVDGEGTHEETPPLVKNKMNSPSKYDAVATQREMEKDSEPRAGAELWAGDVDEEGDAIMSHLTAQMLVQGGAAYELPKEKQGPRGRKQTTETASQIEQQADGNQRKQDARRRRKKKNEPGSAIGKAAPAKVSNQQDTKDTSTSKKLLSRSSRSWEGSQIDVLSASAAIPGESSKHLQEVDTTKSSSSTMKTTRSRRHCATTTTNLVSKESQEVDKMMARKAIDETGSPSSLAFPSQMRSPETSSDTKTYEGVLSLVLGPIVKSISFTFRLAFYFVMAGAVMNLITQFQEGRFSLLLSACTA